MADEALLEELLSVWQREAERGHNLTAPDLCRGRPELAAELEGRIRAVRQMNGLRLQADQTLTQKPFDLQAEGPPPAEMPAPAVPGYEVLGELGRGGMGVVYRARQTKLGRVVALKMVLSGAHAGAADLARFRAEAEAIARLQHPNIVQVHEVGEHGGLPYFSLEYCAGGSLEKQLNGAPRPPEEAAGLVEVLARAMQAAHDKGVIHRDLKPSNVLLAEDGTPRITDFGLAKRLGEAGQTTTGALMGTPPYMAPEQVQAKSGAVGPATDVYALGAILYELLTGRPPFRAATTMDTLAQVLGQEPVSLRRLNEGVPRDLDTICLRCLHKDPRKRYPSTRELADDLRRFLQGEPIRARPVGSLERAAKWVKRRPAAAGVLALFGLLAAVVLVGFAVVSAQLHETRAALMREQEAKSERTAARVEALQVAAPGAVPGILAELGAAHEEVLPRLREVWNDRTGDPRKRMRVALALARHDPDAVRDELLNWLLEADDPAEVILAREALVPGGDALLESLWFRAGDSQTRPEQRFRALVALAAFDAGSERWAAQAPTAIQQLLSANPLHLGTWVDALRPARAALTKPFAEVFRRGKSPEQRELAAIVLADYAANRPDLLADLLLDADPRQYAILFPALERYREQTVERMVAELPADPAHAWQDGPLNPAWKEPADGLRRALEESDGLLAERWALCQSLPLERFTAVADELQSCGYRPLRLRPWAQGGETHVAAVWARDGRRWHAEVGVTADEARRRDSEQQHQGLMPADVAAWSDAGGVRYAALWLAPAGPHESARLYVDVPASGHPAFTASLKDDGFTPRTVQGLPGADGATHFAGVWWKAEAAPKHWGYNSDSENTFRGRVLLAENLLTDVSLGAAPPAPPSPADRFRQRLTATEKILAADPRNAGAQYRRGEAAFCLGRDDEALAAFNAVLQRDQPPVNAYHYRAQLHAAAGRAEEARRDLEQFGRLAASAPMKTCVTALVGLRLGREDVALRELEAALASSPANPELVYDAACVYAEACQRARARQCARAAALVGWPEPLSLAARLPAPGEEPRRYADRAMVLLRLAIRSSFAHPEILDTDPDLDPLRARPDFPALRQEAGLTCLFASVWHDEAGFEAAESHGLTVSAHRERCRELASRGYRPAALSVAVIDGGQVVTASVWHRPCPKPEGREDRARRQATAAATLLRLNAPAEVWPLFRARPDPELRSQLLWRAGLFGADPKGIVARLGEETDVSARRALILALGEYSEKELPADVRAPLVEKLLQWYRQDPDPGMHGAIDWLLRPGMDGPEPRKLDWGQAAALRQIDAELRRSGPDGQHEWYVNGQGQTYVCIPGPVEFRMGSPLRSVPRLGDETPHRRRIPRGFALASKAVTREEYLRFVRQRPGVSVAAPDQENLAPDCPILKLSWFEAAQYCNWLSEKEGLPESEWCYPRHADIKLGMRPFPDYLKRKGYRLPTEAEWEYATRAGTTTPCYFGSSVGLLPRYAWLLDNSQLRPWPVGQKRPNDLGLFDTHGNVRTWGWGTAQRPPPGALDVWVFVDAEDTRQVEPMPHPVMCGSTYACGSVIVRSACRWFNPAYGRSGEIGVRPARTLE
jgi:serine/threonine-protein kinase